MKRKSLIFAAAMVMGLSSLTLTACTTQGANEAQETTSTAAEMAEGSTEELKETIMSEPETVEALREGGVIIIKVNPEIAVEYDKDGIVTAVTARNNEAIAIINKCEGLIGSKTREAVSKIVTAIGDAGYFVEEVDGQGRQIVLEIETGSSMPYDGFMDEVVDDVRTCVGEKHWEAPFDVVNESDYGITDYVDTDYGPNNDGVTDYNDTDYGPNNDGVTDYNDTDYGLNNDGVTDYNDTDYGPNNDGVTDYNDTDYGPNNDGVTDYNDTDYGPNNDGVTDYGYTDYAPAPTHAPAPTQPPAPAPTQAPAPAPQPAPYHGDSGYGNSGYGGSDYGSSNYGGSDYGDSGYDD